MKFTRLFAGVLLLATQSIWAQAADSPDITIDELKDHVYKLASEEFGGRRPGTDGGKLALEYLSKVYESTGFSKIGDSYVQPFDVTVSVEAGKSNYFKFDGFEGNLSENYSPLIISSNGKLNAGAVFAGYGFQFETDSVSWDSYEEIEPEGMWAVILRGAPEDTTLEDGFFDNYSSLRKKVLVARDNGAAGVIFVSGKKFDESDELYSIAESRKETPAGIPAVHIKRNVADKLLAKFDVSIDLLEESINEGKAPNSFDLETEISAETELVSNTVPTGNIIGLIEGYDPVLKSEFVVIGGHYDHLGLGGPGSGSRQPDTSAIHFGADDNASGTAAVLEIGEKLLAHKSDLKRSVIVMNFAAEEMGLLGSKYFAEHPLIDLAKIKLMINMDMVGRLNSEEKSITLGGTGTGVGMPEILKTYTEKYSVNASFSPEGYGPSDHATFYTKDIPVLFAFTGVHDDYHTPRDTPDKVNYDGEKLIAEMLYDIALDLINRDEPLAFQEAGPKAPASPSKKYKVTLGIMPDISGSEKRGLRADAVIEGRPASRAGMQKGDIIVALEGKPVKDIYDYMNRLADFKAGQRITVDVLRGEEKIILIVEL